MNVVCIVGLNKN